MPVGKLGGNTKAALPQTKRSSSEANLYKSGRMSQFTARYSAPAVMVSDELDDIDTKMFSGGSIEKATKRVSWGLAEVVDVSEHKPKEFWDKSPGDRNERLAKLRPTGTESNPETVIE